jgi:hypothetical protein
MIINITKEPQPAPPGSIIPGVTPPTALVGSVDSVPVEIHFQSLAQSVPVGVDIIFLIDNSGSMQTNDPGKRRFHAVEDLITQFESARDDLDRIAIYTFSGTSAALAQSWMKWSDTRDTIQALLATSAAGLTPMASGMKQSNDLHIGSDGFFKMVVLISDGAPTPDDYSGTPIEAITEAGGLCEEAFLNRILYSTIYLTVQDPPDDNELLMYIARATDYITPYPNPATPPQYNFRITSPDQIAAAYGELFGSIMDRMVPQSVVFREEVSDKLLIDPDADVMLFGDGFQEDQNIIGFGAETASQGITSLEGALQLFKQNRIFEIHLNELDGDATLRFSVKLNTDAIDPSAYPGDRAVNLPMPQAEICFKKGLSVRKIYDPFTTGNLVEIECGNVDLSPIEWLEVAEFPTGFVSTSEIVDDFGFNPFRLLLTNRIIPWLFELTEGVAREQVPDYDSLPQYIKDQIREKVTTSLINANQPLQQHEDLFNSLLCQFQFHETYPELADLDNFWSTPNQRGIYKLTKNIPPLATRSIQFRITDASFLKTAGQNTWLSWNVDARYPKWGVVHTRSWYRAKNMQKEEMIEPNPPYSQVVSSSPKPDLFTSSCFWRTDVRKLRDLFTGSVNLTEPWDILNSVDIRPLWRRSGRIIGASVDVRNAGMETTSSQMHVKSFFLPFTGEELDIDIGQQRYQFHANPPLIASGVCDIPDINPGAMTNFKIYYDHLDNLATGHSVDRNFISLIKKVVIINVVDIDIPGNESLTSNNKAIEIVRLSPQ